MLKPGRPEVPSWFSARSPPLGFLNIYLLLVPDYHVGFNLDLLFKTNENPGNLSGAVRLYMNG